MNRRRVAMAAGAGADMLNLTNENAEQDVRSTLVTSDVYQFPSSFPSPRRVMIGVKGSF